MILVVGGLGAGKKTYAREHLGFPEDVFVNAAELAERNVLVDAELKLDGNVKSGFRRGRILSDPTPAEHDETSADMMAATTTRKSETRLFQHRVGSEPSQCSSAVAADNPATPSKSACVATNAEELVRTMSAQEAVALLEGFGVVLLREVGCGIVPVDAGERAWRERVGRLGCLLADEANAVIRVTCGIGRVIKGDVAVVLARRNVGYCSDYDAPDERSDPGSKGCGAVCSGHVILSGGPQGPESKNLAGEQHRVAASASPRLRVTLIRHGATAGTENRRYCGAGTDELLSEEGMRQARSFEPDLETERVFTSGLLRCNETARALFPNAALIPVPAIAEMDFGVFEGKSYAELADDASYQSWVDSWCETQCPGGESKARFTERVCTMFAGLAAMECREGAEQLVCVCHAGTIRALFSSLARPAMPYFDIETDVLGSWSAIWDGEHFVDVVPVRGARLK